MCDLSQEKYNGYCLNNGICYNLINQKNIQNNIFCSCPTEFTGKRCEELLIKPTFIPFIRRNMNSTSLFKTAERSIIQSDLCSVFKTLLLNKFIFFYKKNLYLKFIWKKKYKIKSIDCKKGEICKYFDANMYRCPDELMDCEPYKKASRIPICVSTAFNGY